MVKLYKDIDRQREPLKPDWVIQEMAVNTTIENQEKGQQPAWCEDHVQELRRRVLISLLTISIIFISILLCSQSILPIFLEFAYPNYNIITRNPMGGLQSSLHISFIIAFLAALPVVLCQTWRFIVPGLTKRERNLALVWVPTVLGLFFLGCSLGVWFVFPWARNYSGEYNRSSGLLMQYDIEHALRFFFMVVVPCGLIFEIPALVWILARLRVITAAKLRRMRKIAYFLLLIFSAVLSPGDFSWFNCIFMMFLFLSYEASIAWLNWMESRAKRDSLPWEEREK
ncbi:twin-arginine translocase subunit TatC [Pasteuria penetrans]|uniref:twin-arginine translocase subunit TatC n=1 Tax=Pasteuria penetrans TaxID=86005 RepID=UPI000F98E0EF|nr:twin-arginine translocase subunit TatC [Pasteuria penetrans]